MSQLARTPGQFGEALRRTRLSRGWSQTQLAQQAGLRQATISQIENGHGATRIDTLCAVLAALDLELTVAPRTQGSVEDIEDLF
ncbi:helix-turn-helix transcriptional regulator [uncultured Sphingomonas sp.]|uniref:helix-turn-helix domain-containing protein n=1 Tax=uncultured Sphingomonas sp. TaxID=158754 RepID=UPI0025F8C1B0|nr:helix-turn-helix transcriptional regulator [uncultured Sphingomonas sp.]